MGNPKCQQNLAQRLGLSAEALKAEMRRGYVYSLAEQGVAEDAGRTRLTFRHRCPYRKSNPDIFLH